MVAGIDFDLGRIVERGKGLAQSRSGLGILGIVVLRDRDEIARPALVHHPVRTVRAFAHQAASVEARSCLDARGHRCGRPEREGTAHAIPLRPDTALRIDLVLRVEPSGGRLRVAHDRIRSQLFAPRAHGLEAVAGGEFSEILVLLAGYVAIVGIDHQHRVTRCGKARGHGFLCRTQAGDVRPKEHSGLPRARSRDIPAVHGTVGRREGDRASALPRRRHGGAARGSEREARCSSNLAEAATGHRGLAPFLHHR